MSVDPIDLEVITEGLVSIVREMRQTVFRTAHSPVIADAQDFSCALFDAQGRMVAQGRDMPGHVVAMPASVAEILADFGEEMAAGDIYVVNDPYRGGSHLNDVTLISPVYVDDRLFLFPCVRMHWADIGGMTPGSVSGEATEIFQEGLRFPPVRLVERGRPSRAAFDIIFANVRMADERRGDLDACITACHTAERRLRELASRFGDALVIECVEANMDRTERRLRDRIRTLPNGVYQYEDYLDLYTDGRYDPALVECVLRIDGDELDADFTGSSPQVAAVVNSSRAMTVAGVFIAAKSALDPGGMVNHGAFRPLRVHTTPGTVVHVDFPAPANAHSEVRKRVISSVMAALGQAAPDLVAADQFGTTFQNLVGGTDHRTGRQFLYYDYPPGGNGGFAESDGPSTMNPVDLGDIATVQSVEGLEATLPVVVESSELRVGSSGDGRRRGGLGSRRETRLLAGGSYSVQTDRTRVPPYGLGRGGPGATTSTHIRRATGERVDPPTPGKVAGLRLQPDDVLVMESAGGGGWGDPLDRAPVDVASDVAEGYLDRRDALARYGVVLADAPGDPGLEVDEESTTRARADVRATRRTLRAVSHPSAYTGSRGRRRLVHVSPDTGLVQDSLVELYGAHPAPLRAWVRHDRTLAPDEIGLEERARAIVGAGSGEPLEIVELLTTER